MAKLRPVTHQALTDPGFDVKSLDITITEGQQYQIAAQMFKENPDIVYFNYWDDCACEGNQQLTYSIGKEDCIF